MSLLLLLSNNEPAASDILAKNEVLGQVRANACDWTGFDVRVEANAEILARTKSAILELRIQFEKSNLTNSERAKAHAILNGLSALIESPEPEWRQIVQLFSSPALNNIVGIANILLIFYQTMGLL